MPKRNYIIYADESDKTGKFYSNFFGGVLLKASDQQVMNELLNDKKADLGIRNEIKWQYVDASRVDRYIEFIQFYFEFIATSRLKTRIMFTQNMRVPRNLSDRQRDNQYFLLYYQFIKRAFGIAYCNPNYLDDITFQVLPDKLPDNQERIDIFKDYLCRVPESRLLSGKRLYIPRDNINDVDSKDHIILQGLDLILGAMCSRLNEKLKEIPEGQKRRGKRTRAKERLYKAINREIRLIYPNFNVGVGTACKTGPADRWNHPYRHWLFSPTDHILDRRLGKKKRPQ